MLFWELNSAQSGKLVDIRYDIERIEKSAYEDSSGDVSKHLSPERLVPEDDTFGDIARKVTERKKGDLVRARALYDHVMENMRYMKYGDGWGQGDAVYACNARSGNCTDYHALVLHRPVEGRRYPGPVRHRRSHSVRPQRRRY